MGNASTTHASPFRTLIAAKPAAFPDPFTHPAARYIYYPKFSARLAAIIPQKGVAVDVDALSVISVTFWTMSRGARLVFELRKVAALASIMFNGRKRNSK